MRADAAGPEPQAQAVCNANERTVCPREGGCIFFRAGGGGLSGAVGARHRRGCGGCRVSWGAASAKRLCAEPGDPATPHLRQCFCQGAPGKRGLANKENVSWGDENEGGGRGRTAPRAFSVGVGGCSEPMMCPTHFSGIRKLRTSEELPQLILVLKKPQRASQGRASPVNKKEDGGGAGRLPTGIVGGGG